MLDNLLEQLGSIAICPWTAYSAPRGLAVACWSPVASLSSLPDYNWLPDSPDDRNLLLRNSGARRRYGGRCRGADQVLTLLAGCRWRSFGRSPAADPARRRLGFSELHQALPTVGREEVLTERGSPPPDYRERIDVSLRAVLGEVWDRERGGRRCLAPFCRHYGGWRENLFFPEPLFRVSCAFLGRSVDPDHWKRHWIGSEAHCRWRSEALRLAPWPASADPRDCRPAAG